MQGAELPSRFARLGPALVLAFGALAYWPLLRSLVAPADEGVEGVLFRPGALPPALVVGISAWLLWNRRARLHAAGAPAPALALAAALTATALLVWSTLTGAVDLLLPSLGATGLALAAAARGRSGLRAALLPAGVLLLGVAVPTPLRDEWVWQLQRGSTAAAAWMLEGVGRTVLHNGVVIQTPEHTFQVIDACSGFSGIAILTLVALIVRELFAGAGRHMWLVLPLAPLLGFVFNAARIAWVAASPDPEALAGLEGDHTPQGLAVLGAGTVALYTAGLLLSLSGGEGSRRAPPGGGATPHTGLGAVAVASMAALALLSLAIPRFAPPRATPSPVVFPASGGDWTSESLPIPPFFVGAGLGNEVMHRRYELAGSSIVGKQGVELFVGREIPRMPSSSALLSSKRRWPGPDWNLVRHQRDRLWMLDRKVERVILERLPDGETAVAFVWRLRDGGLWRESLRALLSLEATPLRREGRRSVVRITTYGPHSGQLILDRAKQRLDRFLLDFRDRLETL